MEPIHSDPQPTVRSLDGRREFACFPAAILGFLINDRDEILLLSHPSRKGSWEVVNGAVEAGESPREALLRETREEAGPAVRIKPVAAFHVYQYRFDARVSSMFSIAYCATYLDGDVAPGHDMAMSDHRWAPLEEIEGGSLSLLVPSQPWLFRRAVTVHRLFKDEVVELEPWRSAESSLGGRSDRVLAAILFTDLVDSTDTAVQAGDTAWLDLLQRHDRMLHAVTSQLSGRVVKSTGDGALALFGSVADSVAAAKAIQSRAREIGLVVRAGIHVGEIVRTSVDVTGQAVVMASRLCGAAAADELLVSGTAANLLAGSSVQVGPPRSVALKGFGVSDVFPANV